MGGLLTLFAAIEAGDAPWSPPESGIWATAFSPTARGGVGTTFGIWADGGLRVVKHDATTSWLGVRTMSGFASGEKVSCWATVTGTAQEIGLGLGNASVDLNTYSGADANGFVLFGHVPDVYHNGGSVLTTTGTLATGDRVRMDVDRVNNTVQWYKQTGGTGSYVSMGAALDISALGSGVLYPVSNGYRSTSELTWDFGQGSETPATGFIAGLLGDWGWWNDSDIVSAMTETWLGSDTTRMWETSSAPGVSAPNVVNNDPVGGWYGILYQRLALQSGAGSRPTYTAGGMRFDATGGTKQMAATLASTIAAGAPFTVILRHTLVSGRSIRSGLATSSSVIFSGVSWGSGGKEVASCRSTTTPLAAADVRTDACIVVTYDGTTAHALDSDGTWSTITAGTATTTITHILMRAVNTESTVDDLKVLQILGDDVTETQARNLQWSARNVL